MKVSDMLIQSDDNMIQNKTPAAKILTPLLDALNWQGDRNRVIEALTEPETAMTRDGLVETMANLHFKNEVVYRVKGRDITKELMPALVIKNENFFLILNIDNENFLVFDGETGAYNTLVQKRVDGDLYIFRYADDLAGTLVHQQKNWFNKLIYRFKSSIKSVVALTFLITCLDLLIPVLIVLVYDQIASQGTTEALLTTYAGAILYLGASYLLGYYRSRLLNFISTRMGVIISTQTFARLLYLSPSYTETASVNSQINRIKDFENLKRFITSDVFIDLLELV